MQLTSCPLDFLTYDFSVNESPTLILDPDPTEDTLILVSDEEPQNHQLFDQEEIEIADQARTQIVTEQKTYILSQQKTYILSQQKTYITNEQKTKIELDSDSEIHY